MKDIREINTMTRNILGTVPRVNLTFLPTPLQKLANLSRRYGVEFWVCQMTRRIEFSRPSVT